MFAPQGRDSSTTPMSPESGAGPLDAEDPSTQQTDTDDQGMGSQASGYVTSQELPADQRSCSSCLHFDGQSQCSNPQVVADPEVQGKVEPDGCCNLIRIADAGAGPETQDDEAGELGTGTVNTGEDSSSAFA